MTSREIEENLARLTAEGFNEDFIYDFLLAFGLPKSFVTRLKKGDFDLSKVEGEVLCKGKLVYKRADSDILFSEVERLKDEAYVLKQKPRFVIVTDGELIAARDQKLGVNMECTWSELPRQFEFFMPLIGAERYQQTYNDEADRNAAYELAKLYDILIEDNPHLREGHTHDLNTFLARLLFCYFAEDTGIFESAVFTNAIQLHTAEDGSNVQELLVDLFRKLDSDSPEGHPAYVRQFPYVNGGLFSEEIEVPLFSRKSRDILLNCSRLNWSHINPDIFGSMIQAVADPEERSDLGMHYTSVENILKVIRPLFMDELYEEFEKCKGNRKALNRLRNRLGTMKFFDPACGSGNFLIITYKELRLLEIKIIQELINLNTEKGQVEFFDTQISLQQFYGIEIKDFAHEMTMLSLQLVKHQMNAIFEASLVEAARVVPIIPLKEGGHIVCANAAQIDWTKVCPRREDDEIYLIGNPPYLGSRNQDKLQKQDMELVLKENYKNLDYVSIWFYKGAKYIERYNAQLAFVSTNSICQGEQVTLLWPRILSESNEFGFAHTSFKWTNNAIGKAGVTVIILNLRNKQDKQKYLFYEGVRKEVKNINPYLIDYTNVYVYPRNTPISDFPNLPKGNMPYDGGYLILSEQEKEEYVSKYPSSLRFFKKLYGASELMEGKNRWCLWIRDEELEEALSFDFIQERVNKVREMRLSSSDAGAHKLALTPHKFRETRETTTGSIAIPLTTSERREYIPMCIIDSSYIGTNALSILYDCETYLFGVLHSKMHMVWVDAVGGKLKTDYRYSAKLCYNTFPFPNITEKQKLSLSEYAHGILNERNKYPMKTLAWLYNPETMPKGLRDVHHDLDVAVEQCYRLAPFESDTERLEYLFRLYEEMIRQDTLWAKPKKSRKKK